MINLFDLEVLVPRLQQRCPSFAERFFLAVPDDDLSIERHESPTAFIYESADDASANAVHINTRQTLAMVVTADVVIRRLASQDDQYGLKDYKALRLARTEVMQALVGYMPAGLLQGITYSNGRLFKKTRTEIKWRLHFNAKYAITKRNSTEN